MKLKIEWCDEEGVAYFTQETPVVNIGDTVVFSMNPVVNNVSGVKMTYKGHSYINQSISDKLTHINLNIKE